MQPDLALFETRRCLCLAARRAARSITREYDEALRAHDLRATQFSLLAALRLGGPRTITALADLLSTDRTTLTRNLAVAEQHGWLTTQPDPADARARVVAISAKGSRALEAALPAWRVVQQRVLDELGLEAAATLQQVAGGPCVPPVPSARTGHAEPP